MFLFLPCSNLLFRFPNKGKNPVSTENGSGNAAVKENYQDLLALVCSEHFLPADLDKTGQITHVWENVVPTVFTLLSRLMVNMSVVGIHAFQFYILILILNTLISLLFCMFISVIHRHFHHNCDK